MASSHQCVRLFSREDISELMWQEFFTKNKNTPFVYLLKDSLSETFKIDNIVAYVSNVRFNSTGFSYELHHISESIDEEIFLTNYTIEPIVSYVRCGRASITQCIEGLAFVKQSA